MNISSNNKKALGTNRIPRTVGRKDQVFGIVSAYKLPLDLFPDTLFSREDLFSMNEASKLRQ
jgi:hypothetical protein